MPVSTLPPQLRTGGRSSTGAVAWVGGLAPGLGLAAALAGVAFMLRQIPGVATFSPMILAILLGIGFHNLVGTPARAKRGVTFALRRVLRFAIILLGLQLTAQQVVSVGVAGVGIIAVTLVATFGFTKWIGRLIGVERNTSPRNP